MLFPYSKILWAALPLLYTNILVAQSTYSSYQGKIFSSIDSIGIPEMAIQILGENAITITNEDGEFSFNSSSQNQEIKISGNNINDTYFILNSTRGNSIYIEDFNKLERVEIINEEEEITPIDSSSKFLFYSTNNLYSLKFKSRGRNYTDITFSIEGIKMNNLFEKNFEFNQYQSFYNLRGHLIPINKGLIKGFEQSNKNLELSNLNFRKKSISVNLSNNNFRTNVSLNINTFIKKHRIYLALNITGDYQNEKIKLGESFKKFYLTNTIHKAWDNHSSLTYLMTIPYSSYTPKEPINTEIHNLRNNKFYNPNWGWYNSKIKFAKMNSNISPFFLLTYKKTLAQRVILESTIGYNNIRTKESSISYYNTNNPSPTDYKNQPSYVTSENLDPNESILQAWKENNTTITQINWNYLYDTNLNGDRPFIEDQKAALYYIGDRKTNLKQFSWSNRLNIKIKSKMTLNTGLHIQYSKERFYKTVNDLLGAPYVIDINKRASQIFQYNTPEIQNDIRYPSKKVFKNQVIEYDTNLNSLITSLWKSLTYQNAKISTYLGYEISFIEFNREGRMQNGLHVNNSLGKGKNHNELTYSINTKISYLLNNNMTLSSTLHLINSLPKITNIYFNHLTNDRSIKNYKHQLDIGGDISLKKTSRNLDLNISLFYDKRKNEILTYNYFLETSQFDNQFLTNTLTNISTTKYGLEFDLTYYHNKQIKYFSVISLSNYYYSNNPTAIIIDETVPDAQILQKVYWKNKKIGNAPLFTGVFGLEYKINKCYISPSFNFRDKSYIAISPFHHLSKNEYLKQENLGFSYIINLSIYKHFFIKKRKHLKFHLKIMNILNRTDSKTSGYEQHSLTPNKYYFMEGIKIITSLTYTL